MTDVTTRRSLLLALSATAAAASLAGCGLVVHPERKGQPHGREVDPMIVVLDGLLCLLFLLPGVIAFVVDVGTGCIYFPDDQDPSGRRLRRRFVGDRAVRGFERALAEVSGVELQLDDPRLLVIPGPRPVRASDLSSLTLEPTGASPITEWRLLEDSSGRLLGLERRA